MAFTLYYIVVQTINHANIRYISFPTTTLTFQEMVDFIMECPSPEHSHYLLSLKYCEISETIKLNFKGGWMNTSKCLLCCQRHFEVHCGTSTAVKSCCEGVISLEQDVLLLWSTCLTTGQCASLIHRNWNVVPQERSRIN